MFTNNELEPLVIGGNKLAIQEYDFKMKPFLEISKDLRNISNDFFRFLEENKSNYRNIESKQILLEFSEIVTNICSNCNTIHPTQIRKILSNWFIILKKKINNLFVKESELISTQETSSLMLKELNNCFERIAIQINFTFLVFNKVLGEYFYHNDFEIDIKYKNVKNNLINIYYKNFVQEILIEKHYEIINNFIIETNKIRIFLSKDSIYDKIKVNKLCNIELIINDDTVKNSYNNVLNINQIYDELTSFTFLSNQNEFIDSYSKYLEEIYSNNNSVLSNITDYTLKFDYLVKLLISESFLHKNIFSDYDITYNITEVNIISNNSCFILNYLEKEICNSNCLNNYDNLVSILSNIKNTNMPLMGNNITLKLFNIVYFDTIYTIFNKYNQNFSIDICNYIKKVFRDHIVTETLNEVLSLEKLMNYYILIRELEISLNQQLLPFEIKLKYSKLPLFIDVYDNEFNSVFLKFIHNQSLDDISKFVLSIFVKGINTYLHKNEFSEYIEDFILYVIHNISEKDVFEELLKKTFVKKILNRSIDNIIDYKLFNLLNKISDNSTICLGTNLSIFKHYKRGTTIESEYNTLFKKELNNTNTNHLADLNLKLFTSGITPLKQIEYDDDSYQSDVFKQYLNINKTNLKNYYVSRYEGQSINWIDNMSTLVIEYKIKNFLVSFKLLYKQADLFFLIENEYSQIIDELSLFEDRLELYNQMHKTISENALTKFMLSKKIFTKTSFKYKGNELLKIEVNQNLKISKDKNFDCSKLKLDKPISNKGKQRENGKKSNSQVSNALVLNRIDYLKATIVRFLKINKSDFMEKKDIFEDSKDKLKQRFILEQELFTKCLDALLEDEYIEKKVIDTKEVFKYSP